jgi:hypothetical protein
MQDRYAGDVGDFGKVGLLRALCGYEAPWLSLGVVWYLVPNEVHNDDGKHTGYLRSHREFRGCDPVLFDELRSLLMADGGNIRPDRRRVSTLQSSAIFPTGTVFFRDILEYSAALAVDNRRCARQDWLARALRCTAEAD